MTTKWNVTIGNLQETISSDLLLQLGFQPPYLNDESLQARDDSYRFASVATIIEAVAHGLHGDEAATFAIRLMIERRNAQSLETARQKVAELALAAAKEQRAAETMALARQREALQAQQ